MAQKQLLLANDTSNGNGTHQSVLSFCVVDACDADKDYYESRNNTVVGHHVQNCAKMREKGQNKVVGTKLHPKAELGSIDCELSTKSKG